MKCNFRIFIFFHFFILCGRFELMGQFPGYYVQHFNSENGLPNTIKGLTIDRNGYVWIATESGLARYDGQKFRIYDRTADGESISRLHEVGLTKDGMVCTLAENRNYYSVSSFNTLIKIQSACLFDGVGNIPSLINTAMNVFYKCKKKYADKLIPAWAVPNFIPNRSYLNSFARHNRYFYFLNEQNQIVVTDTALQSFQVVSLNGITTTGRNATQGNTIQISLVQSGESMYYRYADTIYDMDISADRRTARLNPILFVADIPNISGILPLPSYDITIVATIADGIYVFQKQNFTTVSASNPDANIIYAQAPFGTDGSLTSKGIMFPDSFRAFQADFQTYSVLRSQKGKVYLNKRGKGATSICVFDSLLQLTTEIPLYRSVIGGFLELMDGSIWISADTPLLGKLLEDRIEWVNTPDDLPNPFAITAFTPAGENKFWIGGKYGLAKIDISNGDVLQVPELKNINVRALFDDHSGTIWIGTYGSGTYAWYNNRLIKLPLDPNRYLAYTHTFMPDNSGRLWISTNHGLFALPTHDLYRYLRSGGQSPYYFYFDHTAGFKTNEFNGGSLPSGIVLGNGKFSLPSVKGLVQFFADSIKTPPLNGGIFVDAIFADTLSLDLTDKMIHIPAGTDRLRISVSSPHFGNAYNQHIEFALTKSNNNWSIISEDNVIELNNLKKGMHHIALRKRIGPGEANYMTKELSIYVRPMFYETWQFKLLLLTAFSFALYFIYRLRVKFLLAQRNRLEKEVLEKTQEQNKLIASLETVVAELEQSKDDLQKTMQYKEALAMIITHDLQSPLRFLSEAMSQLNKMKTESDTTEQELINGLTTASTNIYHFVEEFGFWVRKANMNEHHDEGPVNVFSLFSELETFFKELLKTRGNTLVVQADPTVFIITDYQLLKIILRNIIDNANKHTHNGLIRVILTANDRNAVIKIADTGVGMRPELLKRIAYYTKRETMFTYTGKPDGVGFGYRFVTDFCRMLVISVDIDSIPAEGTTVTFSNLKVWKPNPATIHSNLNPIKHDEKIIDRR